MPQLLPALRPHLPDDQGVEASVLGLAVFRDGAVDGTVLGYVHTRGTWLDWRA